MCAKTLYEEEAIQSLIDAVLGKDIAEIARIHFVVKGEVEETVGPLQLIFEDGSALLFRVGLDGESLAVAPERWNSYEPLDPDLEAEFDKYGKLSSIDVSDHEEYSGIRGSSVSAFGPIRDQFGGMAGVQLKIAGRYMNVFVSADDLYVTWGPTLPTPFDAAFMLDKNQWKEAQ